MHDKCFLTVCTNSLHWNLFTGPAWCVCGGGLLSCCLLSVIPHSLNEWRNPEMLLLQGFRRLNRIASQNIGSFVVAHWLGHNHHCPPVDWTLNRTDPAVSLVKSPSKQFPLLSSSFFHKRFHLEKNSSQGQKRKKWRIPRRSRPLSSPRSGKAIREQLSTQTTRRDGELEDERQVPKLRNYTFDSYVNKQLHKAWIHCVVSFGSCSVLTSYRVCLTVFYLFQPTVKMKPPKLLKHNQVSFLFDVASLQLKNRRPRSFWRSR